MAKTVFRKWDADPGELFPASIRDAVPADLLVHLVRKMVAEDLDLAPICANNVLKLAARRAERALTRRVETLQPAA